MEEVAWSIVSDPEVQWSPWPSPNLDEDLTQVAHPLAQVSCSASPFLLIRTQLTIILECEATASGIADDQLSARPLEGCYIRPDQSSCPVRRTCGGYEGPAALS